MSPFNENWRQSRIYRSEEAKWRSSPCYLCSRMSWKEFKTSVCFPCMWKRTWCPTLNWRCFKLRILASLISLGIAHPQILPSDSIASACLWVLTNKELTMTLKALAYLLLLPKGGSKWPLIHNLKSLKHESPPLTAGMRYVIHGHLSPGVTVAQTRWDI